MAACAALLAVVYAAPALPASAASSASLSITPKKNYIIEPGKSVSDKLIIRNLDDSDTLNLTLRVIDFSYMDDSGAPKLMLAQNANPTTWSLRPFMTVPESVTVAPGSSKSVPMSIAIPAGHGAGSYYSAIIYSAGSGTGSGNVGLSASGVTLAFVTVPGKVHENLQFKQIGAYNPATATKPAGYSWITTTKPQQIGYTLKNNSNVTESPAGSITLTNLFGQKKELDDINTAGSLALIGQTRTFTTCIEQKSEDVNFQGTQTEATGCTAPSLWPGYYKVSLDAFYGQNGNETQEVVGNGSFWYLPWWFVLVSLIVLLLIAYFVWRIVSFFRRLRDGRRPRRASRRR